MPASSVSATTRNWLTTRPDAPTRPNRSQFRTRRLPLGGKWSSGRTPRLPSVSIRALVFLMSGRASTTANASNTIRRFIFEVPTRRSTKVIGTSFTRAPARLARYVISIWNT